MASPGATFRLFVSSTFSDFVAERDALQRDVFPKLERLCDEHGCRFQAIDLRWGVSVEAGLNRRTVRICLDEIARCQAETPRPNFLVLLGDRYGWEPLPDEIAADEFARIVSAVSNPSDADLLDTWYPLDRNGVPPVRYLRPRRPPLTATASPEEELRIRSTEQREWEAIERALRRVLQAAASRFVGTGAPLSLGFSSISELEIRRGALAVADAPEHVACFLREITNPSAAPPEFVEQDPAARHRLRTLKDSLAGHLGPDRLHHYEARWTGSDVSTDHLAKLCDDVHQRLAAVITRQIEQLESGDVLLQEREAHLAYSARICEPEHFVGRDDVLRRLAHAGSVPTVVHGQAGSGKSSAIAEAARRASARSPASCVVLRQVGATARSSSVVSFLTDLVTEIGRFYNDPRLIPTDPFALVSEWVEWLELAVEGAPLTLLIDDSHLLDTGEVADRWSWLPQRLPPFVSVTISTATARLEELPDTWRSGVLLELSRFDPDDSQLVLGRWLASAGRRLQDNQHLAVLGGSSAHHWPLQLRIAFQEAVHWRADTAPRDLTSVGEVLGEFLKRLEAPDEHGPILVGRALGYLAASRFGLGDDEMLTILSADDTVMSHVRERSVRQWAQIARLPTVIWSRLYHDLEPYLIERLVAGRAVFGIRNEAFREAILSRYFAQPVDEAERHHGLAAAFRQAADPDGDTSWNGRSSRGFGELAYHLHREARLRGDSGSAQRVFALALDETFRERQFLVLESLDPLLECMAYGLDLAIERDDDVAILRQAISRGRITHTINRTFLYRLGELITTTPTLARAVIDLIPGRGDRAAALAFAAWLTAQSPESRPRSRALLRELEASPETTVPLAWVPALTHMSVDLFDLGVHEASALAALVPDSPHRDCLIRLWSDWPDGRGTFARALAANPPRGGVDEQERIRVGAAARRTFSVTTQGLHNQRGLLTPGIARVEGQMTNAFGEKGASLFHALFAATQLMIGRTTDARFMMSRAVFVSQWRMREQCIYLQLAMMHALKGVGRRMLANEYRDRVATCVANAFALFHTAAGLTFYQPVLDALAPYYTRFEAATDSALRPARARVLENEGKTAAPPSREELLLRAGLAVMLGCNDDARVVVRELTGLTPAPDEAAALALYCLATTLDEPPAIEAARGHLSDERTAMLMLYDTAAATANAAQQTRESIAKQCLLVSSSGPGTVLAVAACLRARKRVEVLQELLRKACGRHAALENIDAIVAQLLVKPGLNDVQLSALGQEVSRHDRQLGVPQGMGVYYFSEPSVRLTLLGAMFVAAGLVSESLRVVAGTLVGAGVLGAFADLYVWRKVGIWKRPEYSGLAVTEWSSYMCLLGALFLERDALASAWKLDGTGYGLVAGVGGTALVGAWNRVVPFRFGFGLETRERLAVVVAVVLATIGLATMSARLSPWLGLDLQGGLLLAGAFILAIGLNFAVKHGPVRSFCREHGLSAVLGSPSDQLVPVPAPAELPPQSRLQLVHLRADRALSSRRFAAARDAYTKVIDDPGFASWTTNDRVSAFINRGMAQRGLRQFYGALEDYGRAAELEPSNAHPDYNAGLVWGQDLGRFRESVMASSRALARDPCNADTWSNRSLAWSALKDHDQAEHDIGMALRFDPTNPDFLCNLGALQMERRSFIAARETFSRALALAPRDHEIRFNLSKATAICGDVAEAEKIARGDLRTHRLFLKARSRQWR